MLLQSSKVGSRIMLRLQCRCWTLAAATLAALILSCAQDAEIVTGEANQSPAQERAALCDRLTLFVSHHQGRKLLRIIELKQAA